LIDGKGVVSLKFWGEFMIKDEKNISASIATLHLTSEEKELAAAKQEGREEERHQIADWLEGLSRHKACSSERRYWYEGVAGDIRNGVHNRLTLKKNPPPPETI
jgi:hypothetical protein